MGNNMFAYCNNCPIQYSDSKGTLPIWAAAAIGGAIAGGLVGAASKAISMGANGGQIDAWEVGKAAFQGAITGAVGAFGAVTGNNALCSAIVGIGTGIVTFVETEGTLATKLIAGLSYGTVAGLSNFQGANWIETLNNGVLEAGASAFAGTLFVGIQTEIFNNTITQPVSTTTSNFVDTYYDTPINGTLQRNSRAKSILDRELLL